MPFGDYTITNINSNIERQLKNITPNRKKQR